MCVSVSSCVGCCGVSGDHSTGQTSAILDLPLHILHSGIYKPLHTHVHIIILQSVTIATLIVIILIINNHLVFCVMINSCFCLS